MDSRQFGIALIAAGIALIVYEYWFSYCSLGIENLCFFPFSGGGEGERFPLLSIAVLLFGLLVYFGSGKSENSEGGE